MARPAKIVIRFIRDVSTGIIVWMTRNLGHATLIPELTHPEVQCHAYSENLFCRTWDQFFDAYDNYTLSFDQYNLRMSISDTQPTGEDLTRVKFFRVKAERLFKMSYVMDNIRRRRVGVDQIMYEDRLFDLYLADARAFEQGTTEGLRWLPIYADSRQISLEAASKEVIFRYAEILNILEDTEKTFLPVKYAIQRAETIEEVESLYSKIAAQLLMS